MHVVFQLLLGKRLKECKALQCEAEAKLEHALQPLADKAAGKIYTDIEKGFIRADMVAFNDMVRYKGRVGAREAGKARSEGRDYIVHDGDVILFFHN